MKYVLASCVVAIACLVVGWLAVGAIARHRGRTLGLPVRLLASACLGCAALLLVSSVWLARYYHADDDALLSLEGDDAVSVTRNADGILFDGPGTGSVVIFLPGAKVQCEAYAPLMLRVAEGGVDCLLVDAPAHLAPLSLPAVARYVEACPYEHVILAGHSLGGAVASSFVAGHAAETDGLVLLGAYPTRSLSDDLALLSVRGTEDGVLDSASYEESRALWPPDAQEVVLEGGNHAGFGSYGTQANDGEATMSPQEQQDKTAEVIVELAQRIEEAA